MTRKEAIEELKEDIELYMPSDPILLDRELPDGRLITALEMAIETLEQEPCEDATLKDIFCMGCEYKDQEQKTGYWKPFDRTFGRNIYYCTSCEYATNMETVFKYCPNCGARMEGDEE